MKVLFAASEAYPFIKVGGLGDVAFALPKALIKKGIDARVVLPFYSIIPQSLRENAKFVKSFFVSHSWRNNYCGIFSSVYEGVTFYFLDNEMYFKRAGIYGQGDDGERFAFFSKAVLDMISEIDFYPDVIHANDWHTAMVPVYLNCNYRSKKGYEKIKTVFSIHNIEFQGKFDPYILGSVFGLDVMHKPLLMYDGCLNFLKGAIECADCITTVSKTYANEILYSYHSFGLHNILMPRKHKISGIVNGIDTDTFNPETDKYIYTNYSYETRNKKHFNKKNLQSELGLPTDSKIPLVVMVTRLTPQKGLDLVRCVIEQLTALNIQLVILGTGYSEYEFFIQDWQKRRNDKVRGIIKFSAELASKLYAASDFFLMPSKSEPCGLSQMIAMRYGSVPIVHEVGGLVDTVLPYNYETKTGTGITFKTYNAFDMLDAVGRAVELYENKAHMSIIKANAMNGDYSWDKPADEYIALYNKLNSDTL